MTCGGDLKAPSLLSCHAGTQSIATCTGWVEQLLWEDWWPVSVDGWPTSSFLALLKTPQKMEGPGYCEVQWPVSVDVWPTFCFLVMLRYSLAFPRIWLEACLLLSSHVWRQSGIRLDRQDLPASLTWAVTSDISFHFSM